MALVNDLLESRNGIAYAAPFAASVAFSLSGNTIFAALLCAAGFVLSASSSLRRKGKGKGTTSDGAHAIVDILDDFNDTGNLRGAVLKGLPKLTDSESARKMAFGSAHGAVSMKSAVPLQEGEVIRSLAEYADSGSPPAKMLKRLARRLASGRRHASRDSVALGSSSFMVGLGGAAFLPAFAAIGIGIMRMGSVISPSSHVSAIPAAMTIFSAYILQSNIIVSMPYGGLGPALRRCAIGLLVFNAMMAFSYAL